MSIRSVHIMSSLAAPLALAAFVLCASDARADTAPMRAPAARADPKAEHTDVRPWSRRFPPRPTTPAAFARPRIPAQTKSIPAKPPAPASAPAAATVMTPSPTIVAIEIREIRLSGPTLIERFSLPLGELSSTKMESRVGDVEYRIAIQREGSSPTAPLSFDIRKSQGGPRSASSDAQVRASVRMSAGQHVVIAAMDRSDGSRTEVLAQLK